MADQAREKGHHRARHAGHLNEQAQKNEERHGEQDDVAHALVHPPDDHQRRRARRERDIPKRRQREGEADRRAAEHLRDDENQEKDNQIEIAEGFEPRSVCREQGDDCAHQREGDRRVARRARADQPRDREYRHKAKANRHGGGAPRAGNFQRRGRNERFLDGVIDRRPKDHQTKSEGDGGGDGVECRAPRSIGADEGGHAHVPVGPCRERRAQHGEPGEQGRGEFIRPGQRIVEHIARNDAREQDQRDPGHEARRHTFNRAADKPLDGARQAHKARLG